MFMEVFDIVKMILSKYTKIVIQKESLVKELEINSLDFVMMIVELEDAFTICFDDNVLMFDYFKTVEDLVNYILSKK